MSACGMLHTGKRSDAQKIRIPSSYRGGGPVRDGDSDVLDGEPLLGKATIHLMREAAGL